MLLTRLGNARKFVMRFGTKRFVQELYSQCFEYYYERRFGINSTGWHSTTSLGIERPDSIDYAPSAYPAIFSVLRRIPVHAPDSTFLDYGAGKGRVVVAAAALPFRKVIGVEISEMLADIARDNIGKLKLRRAREVEIVLCDATKFEIPCDVNVIFFFNPFIGDDLRRVVEKIRASLTHTPRKLFIVFFNSVEFDKIIFGLDWIKRTHQLHYYPYAACGIYEAT